MANNPNRKNIWHLFCDESGISGKPFYAFGALWIREDNIALLDKEIRKLREKHNCRDEIKWQSANSKKFSEFYNDLITLFFKSEYLFFNCILVQLAIVNKEFHDGDYETAKKKHFNNLICNKITDSLFKSNMKNRFIVSVDDLPFRYDKSDEEMHVIANNIIRKKTNVHNAIIELKEVDSKKINGIQLCDLLLGSVLSQYQNDSLSERKREVANFVAHHLGWESLSHDTLPVEKKFNIWNFHDPTKGPRIVRSRKVKLKYEMPYKEE